ncbi:MAG TPA: TonB-dependent receptor [Bryobacteraceae bacterium]|nr:TonB-dependent receptor [Bryobacteraceae bacterium]
MTSLKIFRMAAAFVSLAVALQAQTSRGTVTGIVTDPSAAVVANAAIQLTNNGTNIVRSATTNEAGIYRLDAVDPGNYVISATAPGFKASQTRPFDIAAAQVASIDLKLEVGTQTSTVEVSGDAAVLQTESPVRGGTITSAQAVDLPIASRNPVSLALNMPGIATARFGVGGQASFSSNGARNRSNNFMIDGMENNDISVAGQAFQITLPDMVQETNVQTTNFDAEFGRAGGAVVNVITKSGTNGFHGTASWLLDVTNDDAITNTQGLDPAVTQRGKPLPGTEDIWAGTFGGRIKKDRTFFFAGYQDDRQHSAGSSTASAPSAAGYATLNALFPTGVNPRVDIYRQVLAGTTATSQFADVALASGRPAVQFGTAIIGYSNLIKDRIWSIKIDHRLGEKDQLSGRYSNDDNPSFPASVSYPGMNTNYTSKTKNTVVNETHVFTPRITNELRLGYNRIDYLFPNDSTNPLGQTLPTYTIAGLPASNISTIGVSSSFPQGRLANNYTLQDTVSIVAGRHTIRGGFDFLDQRSRQFAPFPVRGGYSYAASTGFTGFANFVDDFGGSSGSASRTFGSNVYYPALFRQSYFVSDRWRMSQDLTLTLGVRYENFGNAINSLRTPAYTGLFNVNPATLDGPWNKPNSVKPDNNNFAPSLGLAWSPTSARGLLGKLVGEKKTVVRAGYSIGYDSFYNNIASNAATSSPNINAANTVSTVSTANPRGLPNLSANLPQPGPLTPASSQTLASGNLVNPYYQKWSFGIQREAPQKLLFDLSYVGTKGTKLYMTEDLNPVVPASMSILPSGFTSLSQLQAAAGINTGRLDPLQGSRQIRTNGGSSYFHSFQFEAKRRFADHLFTSVAYTWSKTIDYVSDPFSTSGINVLALSAVPTVFGGLAREKSVSLIDRPHRVVVSLIYDLPILREQKGLVGNVFGGWQLGSIYSIESGVPYTVVNGFDADGIGGANDRPDVNPNGARGVRAVPATASIPSPTGYYNPDAGNAPIDPKNAQYVVLSPNAGRTGNAGRNTERTPGVNNFNATLTKNFRIMEGFHAEFRGEFYNALNHVQLGSPSVSPFSPGAGSLSSTAATGLPGRFLNPTFMDGGGRVIRYQLKFVF